MTEEYIEEETGNFRRSIDQMIVEIDKTLNAVELEKAGNKIPLSLIVIPLLKVLESERQNYPRLMINPISPIHSGTHLAKIYDTLRVL